MPPLKSPDPKAFQLAIICALPLEADAVLRTFDQVYDSAHAVQGDNNTYTCGLVSGHHAVVVHMPGMGTVTAASVTAKLSISYPSISLVVVAGVCGGVPYDKSESRQIFLGDLIISTSIVQYDHGRQHPAGFQRHRHVDQVLGRPDTRLRGLVSKLRASHLRTDMETAMASNLQLLQNDQHGASWPAVEDDLLFDSAHLHKHHSSSQVKVTCATCASSVSSICQDAPFLTCASLHCSEGANQTRSQREATSVSTPVSRRPSVHFGAIGSSSVLMRSGADRDVLAAEDGIIAWEMEGAGAWDNVTSCIIIKGVCDYADSHKNKRWQPYAATVSACGINAFLKYWTASQTAVQALETTSKSQDSAVFVNNAQRDQHSNSGGQHWMVPRPASAIFTGREDVVSSIISILRDHLRESFPSSPCRVLLYGMAGIGKSEICLQIANKLRQSFWGIFWVDVSSHERAKADYQAVATRIGKPSDTIAGVLTELDNERRPWLLILDNADDAMQDYQIYLPTGYNGCTMITSRLRDPQRLAATDNIPELQELSVEAGEQLLFTTAGITSSDREAQESDAQTICAALGHHPLAIMQAGFYIALEGCPLARYFATIGRRPSRVIQQTPEQGTSNYQNVYLSFENTLKQLLSSCDGDQQLLEDLLSTLALFSTASIPIQIFRDAHTVASRVYQSSSQSQNVQHLTAWHAETLLALLTTTDAAPWRASDTVTRNSSRITLSRKGAKLQTTSPPRYDGQRIRETVAALSSSSFLTRNFKVDSPSVPLHTLVRYWLNSRLSKKDKHDAWIRAACLVASTCTTEGDLDTWTNLEIELKSHAEALLSRKVDFIFYRQAPELVVCLVYRLLRIILSDNHRNEDSYTKLIEQALDKIGRKPDRASLNHWRLYRMLAEEYSKDGRHKESVTTWLSIVSCLEGKSSSDTDHHADGLVQAQVSLARAYRRYGAPERSSSLLETVVKRQSRSKRPNDARILDLQRDLAVSYMEAGHSSRGIALMLLVVAELRSKYRPNHPGFLNAQLELGKAYIDVGRTAEAVEVLGAVAKFRNPTKDKGRAIEDDSYYHLARALLQIKRPAEAIKLLKRIQTERSMDISHPNTSAILVSGELAKCYNDVGQPEEACKLFTDILDAQHNLTQPIASHVEQLQDDAIDTFLQNSTILRVLPLAIKLLERRLSTALQQQRGNTNMIARTRYKLAEAYRLDSQNSQAVRLYKNILEADADLDSPDPEHTLKCRYGLGRCLVAQGQLASAKEAIPHLRHYIRKLEDGAILDSGSEHVDALYDLCEAYHLAKRFRDAVNAIEEAVDRDPPSIYAASPQRVEMFKETISGLIARGYTGRAADLLARCLNTALPGNDHVKEPNVAKEAVSAYRARVKQSITGLKQLFMDQVAAQHDAHSQSTSSDLDESDG
ncbi:hypothetical protein BDZ85DRAFT_5695 [Elsinoe ampelina]|uniref:Nucleoside phosphorylase domain-containing protein n=1 Tax=Elsinoe ampelina TaxID=302913 RepID=A0A6A6GPK6_9PEZI|nr:hypothetical protein BDZ85DRAFT_5695 [Elsinoe ampelina]